MMGMMGLNQIKSSTQPTTTYHLPIYPKPTNITQPSLLKRLAWFMDGAHSDGISIPIRLPSPSQVHPHNTSAQLSSDHSTQQNNQSINLRYLFIYYVFIQVSQS